MAGPYKGKDLVIKIDGNTLAVVEAIDIGLEREGGIVGVFGSATGYHAKGMKRATFTVRRWVATDTDTDLLYDLYDLDLPFELSEEVSGVSNTKLSISNCEAYRYRYVTGGVNEIIAEEISGEGVQWDNTNI